MSNINYNFNKLTPFRFFCLTNFPFIEEDFDSLTTYELLCKIVEYLNKVINTTNTIGTQTEELTNAFNKLKSYVDNYFTNLDVQDEINNKLNEMTKDGTFDKIINQTLFSDINNRLTLLDTKKYVFVGDSYLEGYNPDGNVTSWGTLVRNYMNIPENNVIMSYLGGSSFAGSKSFTNLITSLKADNNVTDVIICGGFNDRTFNRTQIRTGMTSFKNAVNTKFPNAKIHLGFIGWSSNPEYLNSLYNTFVNYTWCANEIGIEMYSGCEYSLHDYFSMFASDKVHPTLYGQESIARNLVNCILNGSADVKYNYTHVGFDVSGSASAVSGSVNFFGTTINNDLVELSSQGRIEFTISNISYIASGVSDIEVATITSGHIIGSSYKICSIPVQLILYGDGKYYNATGILIIRNGKIYISFAHVNASNNNYLSFTALNKIQVMPFSGALDTMFC